MSTPVKSLSSLLVHSRKLSPRAPKLLSPITPLQNRKNYNSSQSLKFADNNVIQVRITAPDTTESLLINSEKKSQLLKYGLSRHDLLYAIGKGSFGTVVKGRYRDNTVAVKIFKLYKVSAESKINEYNARYFSHENIIKIIDIMVNSSEKYGLVVMEYHENSTNLQNILFDTTFILDKIKIINFSKDIVKGLNYCHDNHVLHLDIKPRNILLCNSVCKICDFGNSALEFEAGTSYDYKGTIVYAAPEILCGEKPTPKCDIFSFGVLLWQLITRKLPYESLNNEVVVYKVVKFNLRPDLQTTNFKEFENLCCVCWDQEPSNRPKATEVFKMLSEL